MEWLTISAETGLWGLFLSSFLAATLLPGGSEALLFVLLKLHPEECLGGMVSYAGGRWLSRWQRFEHTQGQKWVQRWGSPILLLAWAPLIGDALCVGAGWLRLDWRACAVFMALGKFARYWIVAQGALW
jgi:membrane protein YqaA with SNARE-associated domain